MWVPGPEGQNRGLMFPGFFTPFSVDSNIGGGAGCDLRPLLPSPALPEAFTGILVPEGLGWNAAGSGYVRGIAAKPVRMTAVSDGLSNTLALAESGDYSFDDGLAWQPPRYSWPYVSDVGRYVRLGLGVGATPLETSLKLRSRLAGGVVQALAGDTSVRSLDEATDPAVLTALANRAGGDRAGQ